MVARVAPRLPEQSLEDLRQAVTQARQATVRMRRQPGTGRRPTADELTEAERHLIRTQAILDSMTAQERRCADVIGPSRLRRIAAGSGTGVDQVRDLLDRHRRSCRLIRQMYTPPQKQVILNWLLDNAGRHGK